MALNNERYDLTPDEYQRYINKTKGFYQYQSWKDDLTTLENMLDAKNLNLTGAGRQDLEKIVRSSLSTDLEGFQRDEYGFITLAQVEDVWREVTTIWPELDLETEERSFFLDVYPVMQAKTEEANLWLVQQGKSVSDTWWMKSDHPMAQVYRMEFDAEAKKLLAKNPMGFSLYYNIILRLLNPDRGGFDYKTLTDDEIDVIRGSG